MAKEELSGTAWHELLDRTAMIEAMVEDYLTNHPCCEHGPKKIRKLLHKAADNLAEAYQLIGEVRFKSKG